MSTTTAQAKLSASADNPAVVPPGYKQTDVGVIPDGWDAVPLGQMIKLQGGYSFQSNEFFDIGVPVIRISDIQDGVVHVDGAICHPPIQIPDDFVIRQGDVLVAMSGATTGKVGLFRHSKPAYQNQRVGKFVVRDKSCISPGFVEQLVRSSVFLSRLGVFLEQGAQPNISGRQIESLVFAAPRELPEQRAIAGALSDVDELIEALDKLITKKRAIKQAAMQQLLTGKTRLPGFSGTWETKALGEVADIKNGATPSTQISAYWNGDIPWCTPTDITATQGKYLTATERNITAAGLASCATSLLPAGALLLCSRATIGEIKIAASRVCTNQGFKSLVCKAGVSHEFLYYLLLTLKPQMIERAIGSTFLEIGKRDVALIQVKLPNHNEQIAIATVLSDMDAEIAALEQRL